MKKKLTFKFDPNQTHQLAAIENVVQLFEGLPTEERADYRLETDEVIPNFPPEETISEEFLLENLQAIQNSAGLPESINLECDDGMVMEGAGWESWRSPSFTIEMETGTGKTYTYLRTIYELRQHYGFRKFIIVVPSIAIYEGVKKAFQMMEGHFRSLYANEVVFLTPYDGSQISGIKNFASTNFTQILLMTVDSFNKTTNNFYKPSEKLPGEWLPYQYVQATRPILILDEPQSIDNTDKAKEAIRTLHPLFVLRYSATHRIKPNLVYRLTPIDAYRQNLVKKIQAIGITEESSLNRGIFSLESVSIHPIVAKVKTLVERKGIVKEQVISLKQGDNLFDKTHRPEHLQGYRVSEIIAQAGRESIRFENESVLQLSRNNSSSHPDLFRYQIRETIAQHIDLQARLLDKRIKVLSLFFIDKVDNYVADDGIIKQIFDEEFSKLVKNDPYFSKVSADRVRNGYFAKRRNRSGTEEAFDTDSKNAEQREAERQAFNLIMKEKERLLSFEEPVCFIFAHSALKEGWDNPNVFQICTLNQTVSELKKRQEIGRGLRLCVDETGERILADDINILTIVANQSYENFASQLQQEYLEAGEEAPPAPKRPQDSLVTRRDELFNSDDFRSFWQKLCLKTQYVIHIDTDKLIAECIDRFKLVNFPEPRIVVSRGKFVITEYTISLQSVTGETAEIQIGIRTTEDSSVNTLPLDVPSTLKIRARTDLARNYPELRGLKVLEIIDRGDNSIVKFSNKEQSELTKYKPITITSERGNSISNTRVEKIQASHPVFDIIGRAAKSTSLTRATLLRIFQGIESEKQRICLLNPEGFFSLFVNVVKDITTEHIVDNIEFDLDSSSVEYDPEVLFPQQDRLPQKELIIAGERGLYDKVQCDSQVEENFVTDRLRHDQECVVLYFKFPPRFKINFPKIIGNYNPDWGIVRHSPDGKHTLQLVRETKGTTNLDRLRFAQEPLKIKCAQKHFQAIGIDYRVIDGTETDWWSSASQEIQSKLSL